MNSPTFADRLVTTLKNNRAVAVALVIVGVVIGGAQFTGALTQLGSLFRPEESHAQLVYRALLADPSSTEKALEDFAGVSLDRTTIAAQAQIPLTAGEPVCAARKDLSELKDFDGRSDIDVICSGLATLRHFCDTAFAAPSQFAARVVVAQSLAKDVAQRTRELHDQAASKL